MVESQVEDRVDVAEGPNRNRSKRDYHRKIAKDGKDKNLTNVREKGESYEDRLCSSDE